MTFVSFSKERYLLFCFMLTGLSWQSSGWEQAFKKQTYLVVIPWIYFKFLRYNKHNRGVFEKLSDCQRTLEIKSRNLLHLTATATLLIEEKTWLLCFLKNPEQCRSPSSSRGSVFSLLCQITHFKITDCPNISRSDRNWMQLLNNSPVMASKIRGVCHSAAVSYFFIKQASFSLPVMQGLSSELPGGVGRKPSLKLPMWHFKWGSSFHNYLT